MHRYNQIILKHNFFHSETSVHHLSRRSSASRILSRSSSISMIKLNDLIVADDAFEDVLQVLPDHETIMSYYYLDENNKVCISFFVKSLEKMRNLFNQY